MLIRGESREVWIFSPTASCCTTLWKTICYPCLLASLAFTFPKLRASKQRKHFQVQVQSSEENVKVNVEVPDDFFMVLKVGCHTIGEIWNISLVHSCSIIIWNIFVLFTWHVHLYHTSNWTVIEDKVSTFLPYSSSWCRCLLGLNFSNKKNFPFPCTHNMKQRKKSN